jgi:hypothetical protein
MKSEMFDKLIFAVKCHRPADYLVDFLDGDSCIVNCTCNAVTDLDTALDNAYSLAQLVKTALNIYFDEEGYEWHVRLKPNFWTHLGEEATDDFVIKNGGIVQYQLFKDPMTKERYER